jgi:hypothetical protein
MTAAPSVLRTIVVVDVEGFGAAHRTNRTQVAVRVGLYAALRGAFSQVGIGWSECHIEDRGDGVLVLAPPYIPRRLS